MLHMCCTIVMSKLYNAIHSLPFDVSCLTFSHSSKMIISKAFFFFEKFPYLFAWFTMSDWHHGLYSAVSFFLLTNSMRENYSSNVRGIFFFHKNVHYNDRIWFYFSVKRVYVSIDFRSPVDFRLKRLFFFSMRHDSMLICVQCKWIPKKTRYHIFVPLLSRMYRHVFRYHCKLFKNFNNRYFFHSRYMCTVYSVHKIIVFFSLLFRIQMKKYVLFYENRALCQFMHSIFFFFCVVQYKTDLSDLMLCDTFHICLKNYEFRLANKNEKYISISSWHQIRHLQFI